MTRPGVGSAWGGDCAGSRRVHLSDRLFGKSRQTMDLNHSGALDLGLADRIKKARERSL
jgi:hypothetical protein